MDIVELWSGTTKALIDPQGAWLTNLSDDKGDILFPKRTLTAPDGVKKVRGGCHVCLPNFGPGGASELPQHGFGRISLWDIEEQSEDKVSLTLKGGAAGYEDLVSTLTYELNESSLSMVLNLQNNGGVTLRVGPAFHPYFALQPDEGQVMIEGSTIDLADTADTLFETGESKSLVTRRRSFALTSSGLSTWAIWTDRLALYVCVEPTFGGYTFLAKETSPELLQPGTVASYRFMTSW